MDDEYYIIKVDPEVPEELRGILVKVKSNYNSDKLEFWNNGILRVIDYKYGIKITNPSMIKNISVSVDKPSGNNLEERIEYAWYIYLNTSNRFRRFNSYIKFRNWIVRSNLINNPNVISEPSISLINKIIKKLKR